MSPKGRFFDFLINFGYYRTTCRNREVADCRFHPSRMGFYLAFGDRKSERVDFERGVPVYMMGIDGTWRRDCLMIDVSQTGARLLIEGSLEGLDLKEFFLLLSATGLAYRRCQLVRVDGNQIGVSFLAQRRPAKAPKRRSQ